MPSTWKPLQRFYVIGGDLASNLLAGSVLYTFMQYSVTFWSRLDAASDVVSSTFVSCVVPDKNKAVFKIIL